MLSSAGKAPLPPGFPKLLSVTVTTFAVFPPGCTFLVATTIVCCLCHLVRVTSTFAVGRVVKFARRQLLQHVRCSITHGGFLPMEDVLLTALPCDLPTWSLVS